MRSAVTTMNGIRNANLPTVAGGARRCIHDVGLGSIHRSDELNITQFFARSNVLGNILVDRWEVRRRYGGMNWRCDMCEYSHFGCSCTIDVMMTSIPFDDELQRFTKSGILSIGVDEVGRGCLAGPVVTAAVIFDWSKIESIRELSERFVIRDSKTLSRERRRLTAEAIRSVALAVGVAEIDAKEIDEINILQATLKAMRNAVEGLGRSGIVLVDGNQRIPDLSIAQETIIGGDGKIFSIAAASIVAKEYRDTLMEKFDLEYPGYDFSSHKGYGTKVHQVAIRSIGLSPIHRKTFWHG